MEGFWFCVEGCGEVSIRECNCEIHEDCGVGEGCKFPGESHCVYKGLKCIPFSCVNVVVIIEKPDSKAVVDEAAKVVKVRRRACEDVVLFKDGDIEVRNRGCGGHPHRNPFVFFMTMVMASMRAVGDEMCGNF